MSWARNKKCASKFRTSIKMLDFVSLYFQSICLILGYSKKSNVLLSLPKIKLQQKTPLELFCVSRQHAETWGKSPRLAEVSCLGFICIDTSRMITADYFAKLFLVSVAQMLFTEKLINAHFISVLKFYPSANSVLVILFSFIILFPL